MLIKNLPLPIKDLVFKRQIEQGNEPNEELMLSKLKSKLNFDWGFFPEGAEFWYEIDKGNYKPFFKKYGGVILCTSVEQGAKIIEYFKSIGVKTILEGNTVGMYYGIGFGRFDNFNRDSVLHHGIPIFTLDELGVEQTTQEQPELPEINFEGIEMEVSNNEVDWKRRKVLAKIKNQYLAFNIQQDSVFSWNHARPIQQKVKVTKEQLDKISYEHFKTNFDNLEIC